MMDKVVYAKADGDGYLQKLIRKGVEHLAEIGDKVEPAGDKPVQNVRHGGKQEDAESDIDVEVFGAVYGKKYRDERRYAKKPSISEDVGRIIKIFFLDDLTHNIDFITKL